MHFFKASVLATLAFSVATNASPAKRQTSLACGSNNVVSCCNNSTMKRDIIHDLSVTLGLSLSPILDSVIQSLNLDDLLNNLNLNLADTNTLLSGLNLNNLNLNDLINGGGLNLNDILTNLNIANLLGSGSLNLTDLLNTTLGNLLNSGTLDPNTLLSILNLNNLLSQLNLANLLNNVNLSDLLNSGNTLDVGSILDGVLGSSCHPLSLDVLGLDIPLGKACGGARVACCTGNQGGLLDLSCSNISIL